MILNAVMCVWNEEDIIESTIKHLFAQGCSNVFVIDNNSSDNTVRNAIKAGGKLAATFKTKDFNENKKVAYLNTVVKNYNEQSNEDHIWWLYVDADEFPNIERWTIINYLKDLDPSIRAIHGYMFNHIPTHPPYHIQGYHPIDFQPLCAKSDISKIPLLRYDKSKPHLWSLGGAHNFITHNERIAVIKDCLHIHHFQYRNPEYTFMRSKILATTRNEWYKKFIKQITKHDSLAYEARYNGLNSIYDQNKNLELKTKNLIYKYKNIVRWYDIYAEKKFNSSDFEKYICNAVYYFFICEYDIALCKFNDALSLCNDDYLKLWLMIKIAECLSVTDINDANKIIFSIKKYQNEELSNYIYDNFEYITNSNEDKVATDLRYIIEFCQSVLPSGIEEKYMGIIKTIKVHI